ncbi:MAG: hypothetical protein RMI91_04740 [Gemmatales bacterium]|nr:hypothetical protein [Gemmatales bacterium]MDW7993943.1 hypothetical protein [Gemmatales bacterium]
MRSETLSYQVAIPAPEKGWLETQEVGDELLEATVQKRLGNRIRDLRIVRSERGVILQGRVPTYYAKQLAQHAILELGQPVAANQIEVQ